MPSREKDRGGGQLAGDGDVPAGVRLDAGARVATPIGLGSAVARKFSGSELMTSPDFESERVVAR